MFKFLKKKTKLTPLDLFFLRNIVKALPKKYSYLLEQISDEFILNKKVNELGDEGTYRLVLNANFEDKFIDKSLPAFFIVKGILIWNSKKQDYESVELHLMQGIICGFKINAEIRALDFSKIDIKNLHEKHFENKDVNELKEILGNISDEVKNQIDIEDSFKIEIPEGVFFTIKNIGDGNYLAINKLREVYALIHDPYQISLIHKDLAVFVKIMNRKDFDVSEYLINGGIKM